MAPLGLVILGLVIVGSGGAKTKECVWDKDKDFPQNPPLLLDADLNLLRPVAQEDGARIVRIPAKSEVTVACPGSLIEKYNVQSIKAKCSAAGGVNLIIKRRKVPLSKLRCGKKNRSTVKQEGGRCGAGDAGLLWLIGFSYSDKFFELVRVCFDPDRQTTLYTEHVIHGANIAAKDVDTSRPSFKSGKGFFNVSMITLYSQTQQHALMTQLLGDDSLVDTIFNTKQLYFAKGHMSPDADFVTVAEQDATYYYINALPQWQAFNNGNWKFLEFATRKLAEELGSDLRVYSGGWGVLELNDVNNNPAEVFLGLTQEERVVPAPAITWKVVHEESTNRAAAVVGVNNPHLTAAPALLCPDLCSSLSWIDFNVTVLEKGYTYCCSVGDLRAAVPHVPDLGDVGLLKGSGQ